MMCTVQVVIPPHRATSTPTMTNSQLQLLRIRKRSRPTTAPKKRVAFNDEICTFTTSPSHPAAVLLPEQRQDVWYQRHELKAFQVQARNDVLAVMVKCAVPKTPPSTHVKNVLLAEMKDMIHQQSKHNYNDEDDETTTTRGLERYSDLHRTKEKAAAIQITLLACAQKGLNGDEVASIARHCSSRSVEQALVLGCRDFCDAYGPELLNGGQLRPTPRCSNELSGNTDNKRRRLL